MCVCVCVCVCDLSHFSCVRVFATLWTVARQALQSMEFSGQEYWSVLPFPSPGDLSDPRSNLCLLCLLHRQAGSLPLAPYILGIKPIWSAYAVLFIDKPQIYSPSFTPDIGN